MMRNAVLSLTLVLTLLTLPAWAGDEVPLGARVQALLAAREDADRAKFVAAILAAEPDPAQVADRLAKGRKYAADVPTGWLERTNPCTDGVVRNVLLYVPETYTPAKRHRLIVDMHGGVSRAEMLSHEQLGQMKIFWAEYAQANGCFLVIPAGQRDAVWWDAVGSQNVLDVIRTVRREYNIDENLVIATGFSDGASGSYYLALAHPTPFAAFIPLNGHVGVAGAGGFQVHLRNLVNKPIYAVNTENDSLYPSAGVKPIIDAVKALGAPLVWRDIPTFRHEPSYLPEERPAIVEWMEKIERVPHPRAIVWEGAADAPGRVHWLAVTKVGETGNDEVVEDVNPRLGPGRVRIGITIDQAFEGPGVLVQTVQAGSPAQVVGLEAGDVLVGFDGAKIGGFADLRAALSGKKFGDAFTLRFQRGEEAIEAKASFPAAQPRPAFARTRTWGSLKATVAGNVVEVHVQRIAAFDLYLSPALVDLSQPVVVKVNGETVYEAEVAPDLAFMLEQALRDEDRQLVYHARLSIAVPARTRTDKPQGD